MLSAMRFRKGDVVEFRADRVREQHLVPGLEEHYSLMREAMAEINNLSIQLMRM